MSLSGKACVVAMSIGALEALKDQGFCRWSYTIRSIHQHAKNHVRSISQTKNKLSNYSPPSGVVSQLKEEKLVQAEDSLRKVMYLSCWGPN